MILFYLLIFLIPFPEYGKFAEFIGDLTLVKVVGILVVFVAVFRHGMGGVRKFWPDGATKYWLVVFFIALFTVHFSLKVIWDWSVHIALFYLVMVFVDSIEVVLKTFMVTIAALLWNCLQSLKGVYLYSWYVRASGSFGDANYFALAIIVGISMTVCLYTLYPKRRKLLIGAAILQFFTLLLTASRGGIIGLGVMLCVFLKNSKRKIFYLSLALAISLPLAIYVAPGLIERFSGEDHSTKSSTQNRINLQIAGLNMVKENPFLGVGYGNFKAKSSQYHPEGGGKEFIAHNSYLSIAAEMGLPMLFLFLGLLVAAFRDINRVLKRVLDNKRQQNVAMSIKVSFIGYCCSIVFLTAEREKYLWLLILLIMALNKIYNGESKGGGFGHSDLVKGARE